MRYTSSKFGLVPNTFIILIGILMALFILRAVFPTYTEGLDTLKFNSTQTPLDRSVFESYPKYADDFTPIYTQLEEDQNVAKERINKLGISQLPIMQSNIDKLQAGINKAQTDIASFNKDLSSKTISKTARTILTMRVSSTNKLINTNQAEINRIKSSMDYITGMYSQTIDYYNKKLEDSYAKIQDIIKEKEEQERINAQRSLEVDVIDEYSYKGCFKDGNDRAIKQMIGSGNITQCIALAKQKGYETVGVQFGNQCWAGNSTDGTDYSKYGIQTNPTDCNPSSPGAWTNVVYQAIPKNVAQSPPPIKVTPENAAPNYPNYKFKGCWTYGNDTAYPILTKTIAQNVTSMDDCVGKASNLGLSSAAYDGSNICFGGGSEYSTNTPVKCKHTYHKGKSWLVYSTDDTNI